MKSTRGFTLLELLVVIAIIGVLASLLLNGASYSHPENWSPATQAIVEVIFGGQLNTPLRSDAEAFHPASGIWAGKNALYFGGRVQKAKAR